MKIQRLIGFALLILSTAAASADAPSPVRAQLNGFLAAFNSGDRATVAAFERDHAPPGFTDATMEIIEKTGDLELLEVKESNPHSLESRVRESKTGDIVGLTMQVNPAEPIRITMITFLSADQIKK